MTKILTIFTSSRSGGPYRGRRFASFRRLSTRSRKSICFLRCGQGSWVSLRYLCDNFVPQDVFGVAAPAQRVIRFHHSAVSFCVFLEFRVLVKHMVLVLHHGRLDFEIGKKALRRLFGVVVRNADGTDLLRLHSTFHRLVNRLVSVVAPVLVQQHQIDIFEPQLFE